MSQTPRSPLLSEVSEPICLSTDGSWLEPFCLYTMTLRPTSHLLRSLRTLPWKSPSGPLIVTPVSAPAKAEPAITSAPIVRAATIPAESFLVLNCFPFVGISPGMPSGALRAGYRRVRRPDERLGLAGPDSGQGQHPHPAVPRGDGRADRDQHRGLRLAGDRIRRPRIEHVAAHRCRLPAGRDDAAVWGDPVPPDAPGQGLRRRAGCWRRQRIGVIAGGLPGHRGLPSRPEPAGLRTARLPAVVGHAVHLDVPARGDPTHR